LSSLVFHNSNIVASKYQLSQPEQLIIKFKAGYTMLLFKSGKFRVMGKMTDWSVIPIIREVLSEIDGEEPDVDIQTMTVVYDYEFKVNLQLLADLLNCSLDCECFPALQIRKYKPVHVNIFSSGKVILCGIREIDTVQRIRDELDPVVTCAKVL
jgi:TATA-box binding protein (TBP) (component of TFIID and TFIIIB)